MHPFEVNIVHRGEAFVGCPQMRSFRGLTNPNADLTFDFLGCILELKVAMDITFVTTS